jgi:hypothetical protein
MSNEFLEKIQKLAEESGKLGSWLGLLVKEVNRNPELAKVLNENPTYKYVSGEFSEFITEMEKEKGWSYLS